MFLTLFLIQIVMGVSFSLPNKNKQKSSIDVIVRFKNKRFKRSSGESIETIYWNTNGCREVREYPHGKSVNIKLKKIKRACDDACDNFIEKMKIPSSDEFWKEVDFILSGSERETYFVNYFRLFIDNNKNIRAATTIKSYTTILHKLIEFEKKYNKRLKFEDIDMQFYNKFREFMFNQKFSDNYFGTAIKCIKTVFRAARYNDNLHNLSLTSSNNFKTINETADTIYLNDEELKKIHELQFTKENIEKFFPLVIKNPANLISKIKAYEIVRNKFLIGCCTALRVSDFNRLSKANISGNFIKITTQKTKTPVVVPINKMLRSIIDSGFDIMTPVSDQKINQHIKEICQMAGIDTPVEITCSEGGRKIVKTFPKYSLVTNHTARRSGATNMYKAGIPTLAIMKITGHKTEKAFMKYIKITEEENAEMLANHPYFKN